MYYIIADEDELIVVTNIINEMQIHCGTLEYSIDSINRGFVLADNKIIFEAGEISDMIELDTLFTDVFTIQIITSNE